MRGRLKPKKVYLKNWITCYWQITNMLQTRDNKFNYNHRLKFDVMASYVEREKG